MQPSKIEWTEFVSNPIVGECLHACLYCYARDYNHRFFKSKNKGLTFKPEELEKIKRRKKPTRIFVGSMYDIWGSWVPEKYQKEIIETTRLCPQHTFYFLTKNPTKYAEFDFPLNCWLGVSETGLTELLDEFGEVIKPNKKFISFEPLLARIKQDIPVDIHWIIIGKMTGRAA